MTPDGVKRYVEDEFRRLQSFPIPSNANPTFLPIYLSGGIGDVIASLDCVLELAKRYRYCVYTKHLSTLKYFAPSLLAAEDMPNFTWFLNIDTRAEFRFQDGFHGFAAREHEGLFLQQPDFAKRLAKTGDKYFLNSIYGEAYEIGKREFAWSTLGFDSPLLLTQHHRRDPKKQITIHDGFDISNGASVKDRCTKQWHILSWIELVAALKRELPDYEIIQVGNSTARFITGVDRQLRGKTTITEAFDVISESVLHIDGDSGLVHAATRMQVPCVVLWGPTPEYFYGYEQNTNLKNSPCAHPCYWINQDWMGRCAAGFETPRCMDQIAPTTVLDAALKILKGPRP
jgi:ADP-heptose:LPS heptosyltransferase